MSLIIPIICGSKSDLIFAEEIKNNLINYTLIKNKKSNKINAKYSNYSLIRPIIIIASAHKVPHFLMKQLDKFMEIENDKNNKNSVPLIITIAGRSNALSGMVCGYVDIVVVSVPPLKTNLIPMDIFSSLRMPSGICPLLILGSYNATIAVLKICKLKSIVRELQEDNKNKILIDNLKYNYIFTSIDFNIKNENIDLNKYSLIRSGKVRDIYQSKECENILLLEATDRISGFDRFLENVPYKGTILNNITTYWFNETKHIIENHMIRSFKNSMTVKKCKVIPIEFVIRAYMAKSKTQTSLYYNYSKGKRLYCGLEFEDNIKVDEELIEPIFTPTTKGQKDELIDEKYILENNILKKEDLWFCKKKCFELFKFAENKLKKRGLLLIDTKLEFGIDIDNKIILIDEVFTCDSSRFYLKHSYKNKIIEGLSKENLRKWVGNNYKNPYDLSIKIKIPKEKIIQLSKDYLLCNEIITGKPLEISF